MKNIAETSEQVQSQISPAENILKPASLKSLFRLPIRMNRIQFAYLGIIISLITSPILFLLFVIFSDKASPIAVVIYIPLMLYNLCLYSSRLQDMNFSTWWILFFLFPFLGPIFMIIIYFKRGTNGDNRFGPMPKKRPKVEYIVVSVFYALFLIALPFAISFLMKSNELLMMLKPA
jgi:uncharacterized membrane protein YhaH (DUF805 family)